MSDIDKKYDVDVSIKETLDRMERQLKKYRIDQSTPTSGRYGSVSSPDSGLATRPSDYQSSIEECGLYVEVKIQGETARFLVDTGRHWCNCNPCVRKLIEEASNVCET